MKRMIDIAAYPQGTKTYLLYKSQIVLGHVEKREINEFDFVNYGIKIPERKTLIWITEDKITDNIDDLIVELKKEFSKKFGDK